MSEHSTENEVPLEDLIAADMAARQAGLDWFCDRGPCAAQRGHEGTCAEASGFILTCEDLGCVDGKTIQGRKYHYNGTHEDQWAPCGRHADTCPIQPGSSDDEEPR